MAKIYMQAQRVISWLGREDEHSGPAMRLIANSRIVEQTTQETLRDYLWTEVWLGINPVLHKYYERLCDERDLIVEFLSRPYWSRLWIVQEFVLARDLLLVCGPIAINISALWRLLHICDKLIVNDENLKTMIPEAVQNLLYTRDDREQGITFEPDLQIRAVLRDFSMRGCAEPRDRVYGLLALCYGKVQIDVDYSKPARGIFFELLEIGNLDLWYWEEWCQQLAENMGVRWEEEVLRRFVADEEYHDDRIESDEND